MAEPQPAGRSDLGTNTCQAATPVACGDGVSCTVDSPLVSIGDVRTVAGWTEATTTIPAGSDVRLRVQVSDGAGPGDIVEGGIDDLSICPSN